jgi:hypothetical protein
MFLRTAGQSYVKKTSRAILSTVFTFCATVSIALAQQSGQAPGAGGCAPNQLCNPLNSSTILEFLGKIIDILLVFALPLIILFIMYAGYLYVTAQGNDSKVTEARSALTWAVIGGVIILGARLILDVIQGTVNTL